MTPGAPDAQALLSAFETWEQLAQEYKRFLIQLASTGASSWSEMAELIDRMGDARDAWFALHQHYVQARGGDATSVS